ncbi:LOW QUALITY PROTEIN: histo-blood group ABO system transferase 1-like [Dasypus novemcinctus]|uniref:LOW QUALITY PROTEIN: histo-blood group ABO system transferase 1-like n=1 Tax=Dasypus novemcinctus TaxID=9361 RepID=UPI000C838537|nr:LOW QUALITY PROTEIN: histo-blood group ABO system transferase 1-like [Dasypus novemcinctus]
MAELLQTLTRKVKCYLLLHVSFLLLITLGLTFIGYHFLNLKSQKLETMLSWPSMVVRELDHQKIVNLTMVKSSQPILVLPCRGDVLVLTPWLAPIIWEGTFDIDILNEHFLLQNVTIGLTVFVIKKYMGFLILFLETAEKYFMVGHKVKYYIFTDQPDSVPHLTLQGGRQIVVLQVQNYSHLNDISMHRMEIISNFSEQRFLHEVDYLVCANVDMKFNDHVGVEILSSLFGTIHPGFFGLSRSFFSYERRPQSQAHIPKDEGDFYYIEDFFGGTVQEVYRLTKTCHQAMVVDQANHIEAILHDESHFNKYLFYHKPTKVLSPEYFWDEQLLYFTSPGGPTQCRYVAMPKNHQAI